MTSNRRANTLRIVLAVLALVVACLAVFPLITHVPLTALHAERKAALAFAAVMLAATALPRRWLESLVPLACSSVLTIVAAEVVVRHFAGGSFATIVTLDDRLLFRMIPGAQKTFQHGSDVIEIRVDSLGHRAASRAAAPGSSALIVFGDSFIEAEGAEDTSTFVEQLAAAVSARSGQPVAPMNAGVVGYGPDQELLRLDDEIARNKPTLVVVGVYVGNDYGDVVRNRLFRMDSLGHLVRQHAVLSPSLRVGYEKGMSRWIIARLISRYRNAPPPPETNTARMATVARAYVDGWVGARAQEVAEARRGDTIVTNLFDDTPDVDIPIDSASPSSQYKINLLAAVLDSMAAVASARHVPIAFVLIPSAIDVLEHYDGGEVDTAKYPHYRRETPTLALVNRLRSHGRSAIDLFPVFRASPIRPLYFVGGDNHWNAAAQRLAAQTVADSISIWNLGGTRKP